MKKFTAAAVLLALFSLCGCNRQSVNESSTAFGAAENMVNSAARETPEENAAAEEGEYGAIEQPAPPALRIEADYGDSVTACDMTLGSYKWEKDNVHTENVSASAVAKAEQGLITAVIDTAKLTGKVKLIGDVGEIRCVTCYRDDTDFRTCEFEGKEITLSNESAYNVYSILVDFPEGSCEYMFRTENSALDGNTPPMLRLCANDSYYALPQCSYHWKNAIACGDTAWSLYEHGFCPEITLEGAAKVWISLPDNAEITSAICCDGVNDSVYLPVEKGTIDIPDNPDRKAYSITVSYPDGECEYIFGGEKQRGTLPPELMLLTDSGKGYTLGLGSYSWSVPGEDGTVSTETAAKDPYQLYNDYRAPSVEEDGAEIILPWGAVITEVTRYASINDKSGSPVSFEGSYVPFDSAEDMCAAYCVKVRFNNGDECEYVFGGIKTYSLRVELRKMARVDGVLYTEDKDSSEEGAEVVSTGRFISSVEGQVPAREGRSNFGIADYDVMSDGSLRVSMDDCVMRLIPLGDKSPLIVYPPIDESAQ